MWRKLPDSRQRKSVEFCHVSGFHDLSVPCKASCNSGNIFPMFSQVSLDNGTRLELHLEGKEELGHSDLEGFKRTKKFRTEFSLFSRNNRPEFRRKRDLYEPLLPLWPKFFCL